MKDNYQLLEEKVKAKVQEGSYAFSSFSNYSKNQILSLFKQVSLQLWPIYGSGKINFLKMLEAKDRKSLFLEYEGKPIWTLVFKTSPLVEDKKTCAKQGYLELKSLFLFDEHGKGHIWKLWEKLLESIREMNTPFDGIWVSVNREKAFQSLEMFQKLWFKILYEWYGKYNSEETELFLYYPFNKSFEYKRRGLPIKKPYFDQIAVGLKTVEWRTGPHFESYKVWDTLVFLSGEKVIEKPIQAVIRYPSVKAYLEQEGLENCLPWVSDLTEAEEAYLSIPGYPEKIEKYGMLAFRI